MPRINNNNKKTHVNNNIDINNNNSSTSSSNKNKRDSNPEPLTTPHSSMENKKPNRQERLLMSQSQVVPSSVENAVVQSRMVVQAVAPQGAEEDIVDVHSDIGEDSASDVALSHGMFDEDDEDDNSVKEQEVTHFFNNSNLRDKYITPAYKSTLETATSAYRGLHNASRTLNHLAHSTGFEALNEPEKIHTPLRSFIKAPKLSFEEDIAKQLQQKVNDMALIAAKTYTAICIEGYSETYRKQFGIYHRTVDNIHETLSKAVEKTLTQNVYSEEHIEIATTQLVKEWKIELKTITGKIQVELNEITEKKQQKAKSFEEKKEIIKDDITEKKLNEVIHAAIQRHLRSHDNSNKNTPNNSNKKISNNNSNDNYNRSHKNPNNKGKTKNQKQGSYKKKKRPSHKKVPDTEKVPEPKQDNDNNSQSVSPPQHKDTYLHHDDNNWGDHPSDRGRRGRRRGRGGGRGGGRMHPQGGPSDPYLQHQQLYPQHVSHAYTAQMQPIPYHHLPQFHQPYIPGGMQYYPMQPQVYSNSTSTH